MNNSAQTSKAQAVVADIRRVMFAGTMGRRATIVIDHVAWAGLPGLMPDLANRPAPKREEVHHLRMSTRPSMSYSVPGHRRVTGGQGPVQPCWWP